MNNVQTIKNIGPTADALLVPGLVVPATAPATPQYKAQSIVRMEWISLFNSDAAARTVTLHAIPAGGSATLATQVFSLTINPGEYAALQSAEVLLVGYTLRLTADVGGVVRASVSGKVVLL